MSVRRALALRPINSLKHIIDTSGLLSLAVVSTTDLVNTVDSPDADTNQVHVGSAVKFIFLVIELIGNTPFAQSPRIYMYVIKNPGNELANPRPDLVGQSKVRKFIIHQEMTMVQNLQVDGDGFPRTMFKGVIRLPKKYQRFGVSDKLQVVLSGPTGETSGKANFCLQSIYKEFY